MAERAPFKQLQSFAPGWTLLMPALRGRFGNRMLHLWAHARDRSANTLAGDMSTVGS